MDIEQRIQQLEDLVRKQHAGIALLSNALAAATFGGLTADGVERAKERLIAGFLHSKTPDSYIDGVSEAADRLIESLRAMARAESD